MRMTRRTFQFAALALPLAAAGGALFGTNAVPSAARLEADLAARLVQNPERAVFSVPAFELTETEGGGVRLRAQVRLDWAPGLRQRILEAERPTAEDAYRAVAAAAVQEYAKVVPGFEAG